jgi:hypothetical protein
VVILTAFGSIESAVDAMKLGAADYLTKPLQSPDELRMLATRLLSVKLIQNQNIILQEEVQKTFPCGSIVTRNPTMQAALELATQTPNGHDGAASGRERDRQGTTGALHPRGQPKGREGFCAHQLCGAGAYAAGKRTVWS